MNIPVYCGAMRWLDICDLATLQRYLRASNVEPLYEKRTGRIREIQVREVQAHEDVGKNGKPLHGIGPNSVRSTYEEELPTGPLITMKRISRETGEFERWPKDEGFNPRRFNPDKIRSSQVVALAR